MADKQPSKRRAASGPSLLLLGALLAFAGYFWCNPRPDLSLNSMVKRDNDALDLQDTPDLLSNLTLERRQSFQCGAGNPCSNGACCGSSGYCGYGPTYCGKGCVSNCGATAQCGQYASPAGTKCPLNTCCSQYGFCGTTSDFCGTGCQSNCVLNPTPPDGGSSVPLLSNRVIGYYESWSSRLNCHKIQPIDLPLDALTHINFAFAYIDPGSYEIVTMDTSTPSSLFSDITNVKSIKQDLSVFVSVGGWSFSNNNSQTQPLYGAIAADAGKRQTFANNVVKFMRQYGFDGLDIDWEYPGAPDRGGNTADTKNYVLLMQTLRSTFDASGGKYGLTFTTPSSYWYLRWFDLPNLMKYADWTNFMTYDLHGVWDATDPIGSIVQGHTNLTEIKLAAELFWRVGISPADMVLGFGFYGRSFTLADSSCTTPGCAFSGASNPGPCTATGGILGYYEILDVLNQNPSLSPIHDTTDAVMYFTFNKNQWVSFDNQATFQQKVDWADSVGLGGAMIWASDLDDDKYTAHAALLGRNIVPTNTLQTEDKSVSNPQAVIASMDNGQGCFAYKGSCVHLDDTHAMQTACGAGNTVVGWDDAGCGSSSCHCGKPICCPTSNAPKQCIWRGDNTGNTVSSDCSAQCAPGEVNIKGISSSWGGGFLNDGNTNKCARGFKVFCCPDPEFDQLTQGCAYTKCRASCPSGQTAILTSAASCWFGTQSYCCPKPTDLTGCHWVTKTDSSGVDSDCANAVCNSTEIEVLRSNGGDGENVRCAYGRKQAACCTVQVAPVTPAFCAYDLCRESGFCTNDGNPGIAQNKREVALIDSMSPEDLHALGKRGQDSYVARLPGGINFVIIAIVVDSISRLFSGPNANQIQRTQFVLRPGTCIGPAIDLIPIPQGPNPPNLQNDQTEHPVEPQFSITFFESATSGLLRGTNPPPNGLAPLNPQYIDHYWNNPLHNLGNDYPAIRGPNGAKPYTANDRMMGGFGSIDWPEPLMATDEKINGPKGRLFKLQPPTSEDILTQLADTAVRTDTVADRDALLSNIRIAFAMFEYMNTQQFVHNWNLARNQVRTQLGYIQTEFANNGWPIPTATQWWDVILDDRMREIEEYIIDWVDSAIDDAFAAYLQANNRLPGGQTLTTWPAAQATLNQWRTMINNNGQGLRFNPAMYSAAVQLPQPPGGGGS